MHEKEKYGDDPGRLELVRDYWLVCNDNGYKYPIRSGIPVMLVADVLRDAADAAKNQGKLQYERARLKVGEYTESAKDKAQDAKEAIVGKPAPPTWEQRWLPRSLNWGATAATRLWSSSATSPRTASSRCTAA